MKIRLCQADRKYLVFVSDGITYMFNEKPTAVAWSFKADVRISILQVRITGSHSMKITTAPVNWSDTLATYRYKISCPRAVYMIIHMGTDPDPEKLTEADKHE